LLFVWGMGGEVGGKSPGGGEKRGGENREVGFTKDYQKVAKTRRKRGSRGNFGGPKVKEGGLRVNGGATEKRVADNVCEKLPVGQNSGKKCQLKV